MKLLTQSKGKQMLSENLTKENIQNLHFETDEIIEMFQNLEGKGYSAMNLKLIIDLIGTLENAS